ncbi:SGT1 protein-domain-containing protein [Panaeolus papilionaceus]|nr:SGT1 protein-domain-containing protein [Panaeolus papilionaceus]
MNIDSIFNRPPSVAEDTLQYALYPPPNQTDKVAVTSLAAYIKAYVENCLPNFIWHRDAFEVKLTQNNNNLESWFLGGRMRVGDSVDDEWCTIWLLRQLSSQWDLVISVFDSDGEFLLIEAAEELPSWVKPTNSENRVWIHDSRLHLIPLSYVSPPSSRQTRRKLPGKTESDDEGLGETDDDSFLSITDAVRLVRDPPSDTFAPQEVQRAVWQRIAGYPAAAKTHMHLTKAQLPADIVKALRGNASLIQRAVEAFYTRDSIQLRVAHRMSRFPPSSSRLTTVRMTRTAYAQLVGQKFFPPKIFGQWTEPEGSKERRWKDLGMKIAIGFEILYQESKGRHSTQNLSSNGIRSSMDATIDALRRDAEYQKYIETLTKTNYFKGEVTDSKRWKDLEEKAAAVFLEVRNTDDASRESFSTLVDRALASTQNLSDVHDESEDDDDWLNVDAESFDQLLSNATKGNRHSSAPDSMDIDPKEDLEDRVASQQAHKLKELAERVEQFVEAQGDLEGAKFEDEASDDEDLLSDEEADSDDDTSDENSESDHQTLKAEKQAFMDKLVPALDPADYGQMPASYHSHSQRVAPTTIETDRVGDNKPASEPSTASKREELKPKPIRAPIIERDRYDGVDSDDETDEEDVEYEESEEDKPQVVGEIEIDMEEEEEEFLEFSRQALGISDEQWSDIIKDRQDRGAFLPASAKKAPRPTSKIPKSEKDDAPEKPARVLQPGPRPQANPELDSFEAIMNALDNVLAETRQGSESSKKPETAPPKTSDKGKRKATIEDEPMDTGDTSDIEDIDAAMEAELKEALELDDSDADEPLDYTMIKNFLESYKSQAGLSGPVSNLAGRLQGEFKLPRDDS